MTKASSRRKRESKLEKYTLDELSQLFFFPQDFAAKMLQVSTSTLKRRFNELKSQQIHPVKWPYFRDSYAFFSQQVHEHKCFSLSNRVEEVREHGSKSQVEYVLNSTEIADPRIIEAETLGEIFKAHVRVYRRQKANRRMRGEHVDENVIANPQIMSIKRNSMHPWQSRCKGTQRKLSNKK